jgi:hypothetical protein
MTVGRSVSLFRWRPNSCLTVCVKELPKFPGASVGLLEWNPPSPPRLDFIVQEVQSTCLLNLNMFQSQVWEKWIYVTRPVGVGQTEYK